mmetsp:Transcript_17809/g.38778  ORF Transcript_17809/g.38778 Transcript_17809/m.38778 type:complete len:114 (+) Transcript_17809:36-377(+)|eukprot:CAMPEP_0168733892 /NCGR_PEP_ID=MMETSP0724-20121128/8531_1 /TAXON_ID=265536 /ORGANISM="Amphiprora sp., Strain CCMP467" /LENGTH=113 /DNA_ID=CAMNT_0008780977 /DNA_START=32 /DNA_END=373 /DNA_ORIENTATION=-
MSNRSSNMSSSSSSCCSLEIKTLTGEKVLVEHVDLETATIGDVFALVRQAQQHQQDELGDMEWKLMAVVPGRGLVPLRSTEQHRPLAELRFQPQTQHRIEVCLAWSELKKVLR